MESSPFIAGLAEVTERERQAKCLTERSQLESAGNPSFLRSASLFSGCGGLDLGLLLTDKIRVEVANEILSSPAHTYSRNLKAGIVNSDYVSEASFPAIYLNDIRNLKFEKGIMVDILAGGPPCQDFSVVRGPPQERKGIEVKRGRLYEHFVRGLKELSPKAFIFENVPGLVSANGGTAFTTILGDFDQLGKRWGEVKKDLELANGNGAGLGYQIIFKEVVNMSDLGVPQSRRRLIVVGVRKEMLEKRQLETAKMAFRKALLANDVMSRYPLTPIEAFEGRPLPELQGKYEEIMRSYEGIDAEVGTKIALKWRSKTWDSLTFDIVRDYLALNKIEPKGGELEHAFKEHEKALGELGYLGVKVSAAPVLDGTGLQNGSSNSKGGAVSERMKRIPPGENHEFVEGTPWRVSGRGMSLIYRRIHPLKPAYTVVAYGGGGTWGYHYERERAALTNRERARLQTFPDSFYFCGSLSEIRAQIGEAVPVLAAKKIGQALYNVLELIR